VIENSTLKLLSSKSWLEASEEVVLKVLGMTSLHVTETTLFNYFVEWGRAGATDDAEARAKIDSGLKLIRFCTMSWTSFSTLCCQPLPLSKEEQLKILLCITQRNAIFLPEGFSISKWPRCIPNRHTYMWNKCNATKCTVDHQTAPFTLKVTMDTPRYLVGLKLTSLTGINVGQKVQLTCEVFNPEQTSVPMASAAFNNTVEENLTGILYMSWPVLMHPGITYSIKLSYQHPTERPTSMYAITEGSFCWHRSDKDKRCSVNVECDNDSIVDICGFILGKEVV
jgi:hypothetical protein